MDVTDEMAAEDVPEANADIPDIPDEDVEPIHSDEFGHSAEAHEARSKPSPIRPSSEAIESHYRTHCPYRSWCPVCVAASGREDPHPREKGRAAEDGLPVVSMDYELLEEKLIVLVVKDECTGTISAYDCLAKGPSDVWALKQLARDLEDWGRRDIHCKTDGEPAMLAVQRALAAIRAPARTIPCNPPTYNPQANGGAEKACQDFMDVMRRMLLGLESRLSVKVDVNLPIVKWLIRHAAFVRTRYQVGHDGLTAWKRLTGRTWNGIVMEFGEQVRGKLAMKKPSTEKKVKRGKKKLAERNVLGTWLGIHPRTGEHVIAIHTGEAIRVRSVHRVVPEERWSPDAVRAVQALPRRPGPEQTEPAPRRLGEDQSGKESSGANLEQPEPEDRQAVPRELKIDQRLLDKYGYTEECPGCIHRQLKASTGVRMHSTVCRCRIYECMMKDDEEMERITAIELKMGRLPSQHERIRRPNAGEIPPKPTAPVAPTPEAPAEPEDEHHENPIPGTPPPERDEDEVMEDGAPQNSASEEDDDEERLSYRQDSPDDDESEDGGREEIASPASKKQRTARLTSKPASVVEGPLKRVIHALSANCVALEKSIAAKEAEMIRGVRGAVAVLADEPLPGETPSTARASNEDRRRIQALFSIAIASVSAKKILEDLSNRKEFKLKNIKKKNEGLLKQAFGFDCGEVYSPPRITKMASDMGLHPAWALDLTVIDSEDGTPWDFSIPAKQKRAIEMLDRDKPAMLIACPMCGPFSSMNNINYAKMDAKEVEEKLRAAMVHIKFALELCLKQYMAGRLFLFEHPAGASSWSTGMMKDMLGLAGVHTAKFDFCELGMTTKGHNGNAAPAKKRTTVMTNSPNIAEVLRQAQCSGLHRHVQLDGGKAKACEVYPEKFVKLVCEGIRKELADARWRRKIVEDLAIGETIEALMHAQEKVEPPHEQGAPIDCGHIYENRDFYDDISGAKLDHKLAVQARRAEMAFFKQRGVYSKVRREKWMTVISTKWLDVNKGDERCPNIRARLVGREIAKDKRDDLFAATPPLESLKAILSICASHQVGSGPYRVMAIDVKRAYFYAPATRPIFVHIPAEDREPGDEKMVGQLNLSLYGTRDAALNWTKTYTQFMLECGFEVGRGSPCNFVHRGRGVVLTVHGDDFTSTGTTRDLAWLQKCFEKRFEVTTTVLGPEEGQSREVRILNRIIRWTAEGIAYEPDPRHSEIAIRDLGLDAARTKAASTPGTKEETAASSVPTDATCVEVEEESELMTASEATLYRGIAARLNYLAQDRIDIQYACKEASRRMARPRVCDWPALKRIGRYLKGAPRYVQSFVWQTLPEVVDTYTDSDWAGCKSTCRSTSGGVMMWGLHCLKSWASTQATVALSSAEAELYALTKGASQALGVMALLEDFGIKIRSALHTDASAAIGIVRRAGLGKLRHLNVRYLWLQDHLRGGEMDLHKVAGVANAADLVTKHLGPGKAKNHLEAIGVRIEDGRATSAPTLSSLNRALRGQGAEQENL